MPPLNYTPIKITKLREKPESSVKFLLILSFDKPKILMVDFENAQSLSCSYFKYKHLFMYCQYKVESTICS